jgi:CRISPR-associated endonuclease/helicase Cas3
VDKAVAHIRPDGAVQSLADHLKGVAELADGFATRTSWRDWAYNAGLLHDVGKRSAEFQEYIRRVATLSETERGRHHGPDHSTAGAQLAGERFSDYVGWLMAYAVAGHHGGLPDGRSGDLSSTSSLEARLEKKVPEYKPLPLEDSGTITFEQLPFEPRDVNPGYAFFFFVKMLFSCLVDADWLDTEAFMAPSTAEKRLRLPTIGSLRGSFEDGMSRFLADADENSLNRRRREIYESCLRAAEGPVGLYSLTVPTGGGKTLSSLAFALRHAEVNDLKRVIYVIPYTSIIEQNAQVFRKLLGADAVIEHHSNYDPRGDDLDEDIWRLAAENWDAPLIVTTNVQFFESLFHHRPSHNRKLHNVMRSVVILDEAQMLPVPLLRPCLEALKALSVQYGTTVVLCTATQPALTTSEAFKDGLEGVREIIPPERKLYDLPVFRRTEIELLDPLTRSLPDLAECVRRHERVLCIVNTRRQARELFNLLESGEGGYHLSSLMCPAHRRHVLDEIKDRLKHKRTCRVVSTQLVEAGVDIDFPVVFRALAGVDSIAQAAGRCNREGKLGRPGKVCIFRLEGGEPPGLIKQGAQVAERVLERYGSNILSPEAVEAYFQELFWLKGDGLDSLKIGDRLNRGLQNRCDIPFRTIGELFHVIEKSMAGVIIPWDEKGRELEGRLRRDDPDYALLRTLQSYTVQVYQRELDRLTVAGAVEVFHDRFNVLVRPELYNKLTGLVIPEENRMKPEDLIT